MKHLVTFALLLAAPLVALTQPATFALQTNSPSLSGTPYGVTVADVNGDGRADVLVPNYYGGFLSTLLGDGKGGFGLYANTLTGSGSAPHQVAVADVNGDGKLDALVADISQDNLVVLLGDGTGYFTLRGATSTGLYSEVSAVAVADVNGDGKPDVLAANYGSSTLGVLLGNGTGDFTLSATWKTGANSKPGSLAVADVNGDGYADVLMTNYGTSTLGVLLGDGKGSFVAHATPGTGGSGTAGLALADVNGDGKLDALVTNNISDQLAVLLGDGTGSFTLHAVQPTGPAGSSPVSVAVADVNGDGKLDALTANFKTSTLGILLGDGKGSFTLQANLPTTGQGSSPASVAVVDVNGDQRPDALTANFKTGILGVLLNTSTALPTRAALPGSSATLYPNPARTTATLTLAGLPATATRVQATLLDATGRTVGRHPLGTAGSPLPLSELAPGLYVVRLAALDAQGQVLSELPAQRLSIE